MTEGEVLVRFRKAFLKSHNFIEMLDRLKDMDLRIIEDQPDHIIEFRVGDEGSQWQMQHSVDCRTSGKLLDCPIHTTIAEAPRWVYEQSPGRYKVWLNDEGVAEFEKLDGV